MNSWPRFWIESSVLALLVAANQLCLRNCLPHSFEYLLDVVSTRHDLTLPVKVTRNYYDLTAKYSRTLSDYLDGKTFRSIGVQLDFEPTGDYRQGRLAPGSTIVLQNYPGELEYAIRTGEFDINSYGMRDRERQVERIPGKLRLAVLGGSPEFLVRTPYSLTIPGLLETRLNETPARFPSGHGNGFEVLNFSNMKETAFFYPRTLEAEALKFKPDAVLIFVHTYFQDLHTDPVLDVVNRKLPVPYPEIRRAIGDLGDYPGDARKVRRLFKTYPGIFDASVSTTIDIARSNGIRPVLVSYNPPAMVSAEQEERRQRVLRLARSKGVDVIDLGTVFAGQDRKGLLLASDDDHQNELANQIIVKQLVEELYGIFK